MLPLPSPLASEGARRVAMLGLSTQQPATLFAVLACSEFVADNLQQYPHWLTELQQSPPTADEWRHYRHWLGERLRGEVSEAQIMHHLRLFRRQMLVRIAWQQILFLVTTEQTLQQLSELAEVLIIAARDWCWQQCCQEMGTPCNQAGEAQPLLILGMGKLGGGELNFSSDIDLIFAWPENGTTRGGRRELDNAQFFTRMGQRLIKLLDQPTADGFVYRVDMRLRPFGDSGPLVMSFAALEDYYQEQGRDWERYAMVKARIMGGEDNANARCELQQMLRPFVYRRYIDFSVIQSLRTMKGKIRREVRRRGLTHNFKLGAGGIRECEFIVQVFQLIRGGREPLLQQRPFLAALPVVKKLQLLTPWQAEHLQQGYLFLRRLENVLQSIVDQQTQTLPDDPLNQQRLTWMMGYSDWQALLQQLTITMADIHSIFCELIGDEEDEAMPSVNKVYQELWLEVRKFEELSELTPHLSGDQQRQLLSEIDAFQHDIKRRTLGPRGRQALDQLMPALMAEVCGDNCAGQLFQRLAPVLISIVTRSTYLELLIEYPNALRHLIRLCAASPMVATQLARHPLLLDELLDPATLYQPTPQHSYRQELCEYLMRIPVDDEEQQVEAMRQFKLTQQLRIAAADIAGGLAIMKVSDHLTWLAEAVLAEVVQQAWQMMVQRYGTPDHLTLESGQGFAVVGYGKLGGWELGYSSDLDLVFLHDCPEQSQTTGARVIDGRQFYLKMAQRIIHLFSVRTASGILYEVDARLRPSGSAGMLVTTFAAFAEYQHHDAWTWEHQALVRARIVYAPASLQKKFEQIRHTILTLARDHRRLRNDVVAMRYKMLKHLADKHLPDWDIKADAGGITDIEFLAQYFVLAYAAQQPALTCWSDNVRIFQCLAEHGILTEQQAEELKDTYIRLRDALHHLALQGESSVVANNQFQVQRQTAQGYWQHWLGDERV